MKQQKWFISILLIVGIIALLIVAGYFIVRQSFFSPQITPSEETQNGGISGRVLIWPQCPVVSLGTEEQCADKPYQTTLIIMTKDRSEIVAQAKSDKNGKFHIVLPSGDYIVASPPASGSGIAGPYCKSTTVSVELGKFTDVVVHCDTGIR